jgi:1-deoxy-D-xylulose-5-phosphate synthase
VVTKKGIGYKPAEENPSLFHGVGPYDRETGKSLKKSDPYTPLTYTQAFGKSLLAEAERDPQIVAITAAMADGTGLHPFFVRHPERAFDVGISEEHAVGMASGLALGGVKPVVTLYSTFLQRAVDQSIIDVALPKANVVFAVDRAGLVGDDGPTHHGVFDLVYLRMIPNLKVLCPSDEAEVAHALHTALALEGPVSLRYPRGAAEGVVLPDEPELLEVGKSRTVREGDDVAVLAFGRMVGIAKKAAELLADQGVSCRVVDMRWAKPLDEDAIRDAAATKLVVTMEEGVLAGGVGDGVLEVLSEQGSATPTLLLGLPDAFVQQGDVSRLLADCGLSPEAVAQRIAGKLGR